MNVEDMITEQRQNIIAKLVEARLEKGITQIELAKMIGTQRSNICRLESGAQNPSIEMLLKIAAALGKRIDFELSEKEETIVQTYILKLYDIELVRFTLADHGLEGLKAELVSFNRESEKLLPYGLELTGEGILTWLKSRVVPKNRRFVEEILATFGLNANDTKGIIDVCKGLSLNDSYWVVEEDFKGRFSDYNLYENRFSEILSLVAYTGVEQSHGKFTTSPELTTGGALPKAWRYIEGDGIYLYKSGNDILTYGGKEPYSEYYASQIATQMGLNAIYYDLENWKGILASKCKLFNSIDVSYVPIWRVIPNITIKKAVDYYDNLGAQFGEQIRSMLMFDALIYNEDRHFGNFGLLRDNKTGEFVAPAPMFDHGHALFSQAAPEKFDDLEGYAKILTTPYDGLTFDKIAIEVIGKTQIAQLRKMANFVFTRHPSLNLDEERLQKIEVFVRKRAVQLLALARSHAAKMKGDRRIKDYDE
ncbi:MAG: helix-turn-helix domain-containing protein [Clostridia bacterium]|nr:helix-turn-helix domain-containing protein [Clostridia bacterium]